MTRNVDWNDVAKAKGHEFIQKSFAEFMASIQTPDSSPAPSGELAGDAPTGKDSPAPSENTGSKISIGHLLKRYLLIYSTTDVWDTLEQCKLKRGAFTSLVGKEVARLWYDSPDKRQIHPNNVGAAIAAKQKEIVSSSGKMSVEDALQRYTYLEPSKTVWDHHLCEVVNIEDLKFAIPDVIDIWIRHPDRREILKRNLVFDPTQSVHPQTHINMFNGLPLTPDPNKDKCAAIRELSFYLCNGDPDIWRWLMCWLAYPLQNVGAKMATAVLMHSEVHGSGKSLFFDVVMRPIYGEYGATLGQHQMETPYTDWQSRLLYGVFEELFSRDGKHDNLGKLKQMITGAKVRIEKKFMSSWEESNHMNSVFLSNEIMPFPIEPSDRRFLVIWPEAKMAVELQDRVDHEVRNGGIEAWYHWLLHFDVGDFQPHTKPPMTEAKDRLIEFSKPVWEFFVVEWQCGSLDVPYQTCAVSQLFEVYRKWCTKGCENGLGRNKFANLVSRRVKMRKNLHYELSLTDRRQQSFFIVDEVPEDRTQSEWLGDCYRRFQSYLDDEF